MKKLKVVLLISVVNVALLLFIKRLYGFETAVIAGIAIITTYLVSLSMDIENK